MKKHILISALLVLLISESVFSQGSLEVTIQNIREAKGTIRVNLFINENDYLKKSVYGKVVKALGSEVTVAFENLQPGEYAVSIVHDENENEKLDSNIMGIPKEGFAFGNNATGMFGPPDFEKTIIKVDNQFVKQVITMKYM